jgi:hypothetical protein
MVMTMQPHFEGELAGRTNKPHSANPYRPETNDYLCWENGWLHGEYYAARASEEDEQEIRCPECTAEGKRVRLQDGCFLWDPDGYISPISDPDGPEVLYCEECHTSFERKNNDWDGWPPWSEPEHIEDSSPSISLVVAPAVPQFVYVVRSGNRIRIGKAKSRSRYLSYRVALPQGCEILRVWTISFPKQWEDHLHIKYAGFKIHGSWYEFPEHVLQELLSLQPPEPS